MARRSLSASCSSPKRHGVRVRAAVWRRAWHQGMLSCRSVGTQIEYWGRAGWTAERLGWWDGPIAQNAAAADFVAAAGRAGVVVRRGTVPEAVRFDGWWHALEVADTDDTAARPRRGRRPNAERGLPHADDRETPNAAALSVEAESVEAESMEAEHVVGDLVRSGLIVGDVGDVTGAHHRLVAVSRPLALDLMATAQAQGRSIGDQLERWVLMGRWALAADPTLTDARIGAVATERALWHLVHSPLSTDLTPIQDPLDGAPLPAADRGDGCYGDTTNSLPSGTTPEETRP